MDIFGLLATVTRPFIRVFLPAVPPKPAKIRLDLEYSSTPNSVTLRWDGVTVELWSTPSAFKQWFCEKVMRYRRSLIVRPGSQVFTNLTPGTTIYVSFSIDARTGAPIPQVSASPGASRVYPYLRPFAVCTTASGLGTGGGSADALIQWL